MGRSIFVAVGLGLLLAGAVWAAEAPKTTKAELVNAKGEKIGAATLEDKGVLGVLILLEAEKLPPGVDAIHIHAVGKCDPPDFKSAGPHFNPAGKKHGMMNPEGPHAGDLMNIGVGFDGKVKSTLIARGVTLGPGPNSLFSPEGTSLVIHAGPDDNKTDPSGNSGDRIACGVIKK